MSFSFVEYVDFLMTWVQVQLDDESLFPSKVRRVRTALCLPSPSFWSLIPALPLSLSPSLSRILIFRVLQIGIAFPKNFLGVVKAILRRLFRVYAHTYHAHFNKVRSLFCHPQLTLCKVVALGEEPHLNTSFKHFVYFVQVRERNRYILPRVLSISISIFIAHHMSICRSLILLRSASFFQ